jgi:hypothetical protein
MLKIGWSRAVYQWVFMAEKRSTCGKKAFVHRDIFRQAQEEEGSEVDVANGLVILFIALWASSFFLKSNDDILH